MPELSKLEWMIPRKYPNIKFDENIYCLGDRKYVFKTKSLINPRYYMIDSYFDGQKEFFPSEHPDIDLSKIKTYQIKEQIDLVNKLIDKSMEYLESLPNLSLIINKNIIVEIFGAYEFINPSTYRFSEFDLEKSMYSVYYHDLFEKANKKGIYTSWLGIYYTNNEENYHRTKDISILIKNCLPEKIETEDNIELIKETFSGHKVKVVYSKKENKYISIIFEESQNPKRKEIPDLIKNDEFYVKRKHGRISDDAIFDAANKNDFLSIKKKIANGCDINSHNSIYGNSVLSVWLNAYYEKIHSDLEESIYTGFPSDDLFFPLDILCIPLKHRKDNLYETINWMIDNGLNLNDGYSNNHTIEDTPLSLAISNMDYYLTEFLLEHGADPYEWIDTEIEDRDIKEKEDILGIIIASYLGNTNDPVLSAIWLKFAKLLMKYGYEGEFFSYPNSLYIEPEKDSVYFTQTAFPKY